MGSKRIPQIASLKEEYSVFTTCSCSEMAIGHRSPAHNHWTVGKRSGITRFNEMASKIIQRTRGWWGHHRLGTA